MECPTTPASHSHRLLSPVVSHQKHKPCQIKLCTKTHFESNVDFFGISASIQGEKRNSLSGKLTEQRHQTLLSIKHHREKYWVHFIGIGGCGLSALAMLALKQGMEVSGSDIVWSSFMDGLQEAGARLYLGHSISNIKRNGDGSSLPNAIVVSSAIPPENVEILHAKSLGVPVYKRDYWLGKITEHYNLIAVSGTHGTTFGSNLSLFSSVSIWP